MTFFFLPLEDLESCIVRLKAKSTWCSRGPQGCFPRTPHQICSLGFYLSHIMHTALPSASPGLSEVPHGWWTCWRSLQSSSLLAEWRGLISFGEKWGVCSCPPVFLWPLSLQGGGSKGAFSLPTCLLCKLDIWSEGGWHEHTADFPGSLGFALQVYPDRCIPSSFRATFQP